MIRALTSCRFAGRNYSAGAIVPATAINKKMVAELVRMEIIALEPDPPPVEDKPKKPAKR